MIETAEEFIRLRTSMDPDEYERTWRERAPLAVWFDLVVRYPGMRTWVILNETVPNAILVLLSRDDDWRVRAMVASRRTLSLELFEKLARDPNPDVRLRIACNSMTPYHVLLWLLDDDVDRVRYAAKARVEAYYAA
jgi:hypothetical protein